LALASLFKGEPASMLARGFPPRIPEPLLEGMGVADEKRGFGWKLVITNPFESRQGVQEGWIRETGEEHGRVRAGGRH
jgi:hypothetical protein